MNFKYFYLFFCVVVCSHNLVAQHIKTDFRSPIGIPIILSGNFGELRTNHFHTGLDIKTNGSINYRIYAVDSGYVSRIKVSHWGYGKAIYVDHPNGFTSFGSVISSMFLQNGSSKSRINSKTPGLNNGGRGQSIDKSAFEINLAPGNLFNWSTKSSKLSA